MARVATLNSFSARKQDGDLNTTANLWLWLARGLLNFSTMSSLHIRCLHLKYALQQAVLSVRSSDMHKMRLCNRSQRHRMGKTSKRKLDQLMRIETKFYDLKKKKKKICLSVPFCAQIFTTCTRLNVLSCSNGSVMNRLLHGSAAQTTNNKTGSPLTGHLSVLLSFFFFPLVPTIMVMIIPAQKGCVCVDDNNNENTTFCHFFFMKQITCRLKNVWTH